MIVIFCEKTGGGTVLLTLCGFYFFSRFVDNQSVDAGKYHIYITRPAQFGMIGLSFELHLRLRPYYFGDFNWVVSVTSGFLENLYFNVGLEIQWFTL